MVMISLQTIFEKYNMKIRFICTMITFSSYGQDVFNSLLNHRLVPAHKKFVLIAYTPKSPLTIHADASIASQARGLYLGLSLHLHRYNVCDQLRLWRVCAYEQTRMNIC